MIFGSSWLDIYEFYVLRQIIMEFLVSVLQPVGELCIHLIRLLNGLKNVDIK